MPQSLKWGIVTAVTERADGLVRLEVDGAAAVSYTRVTGGVEEGDVVLVNTQARDLELGSGGFDVLHVNLTRGLRLAPAAGAHVMVLPYTPGQHAAVCAEEEDDAVPELGGMPVVCCGLHSQVAPVCSALRGLRVAYVQVAGGALPVSLSDTVRQLKVRRLVDVSIAAAPCFDADVQCVTIPSALTVARARGAEVAVCAVGPGLVGTGSRYGHGGLVVADVANATVALKGRAVVAPRVSFGDDRERHRGLSHHTRTAVSLCLGRPEVAWPAGLERPEGVPVSEVPADGWEEACEGLTLSHMGRGPGHDPWFFASAYAAGVLARSLAG